MMAKLSREPACRDVLPESPLAALAGRRRITEDDVAALRASDMAYGLRGKAEAEMLFAIDRGRGDKCRAWGEFLVEAVTDFVVWDQRPSGVLTDEMALWLGDQVGETPTPAGLTLLVAVADGAEVLPAWFVPAVRLRASRVFGRRAREVVRRAA